MKNLFGILCILGGVWAPKYTIVNPFTGEAVTNNDLPIELDFNTEVPSLADLQTALKAIKPELIFEGLITNAHLLQDAVKLTLNNTAELLADDCEIGLVTHVDTMKLPMGDAFDTRNVSCELLFTYRNTYSADQNRTLAQRFYDWWSKLGISNTMYSVFMGSGRNLLEAMTPYIDKINFGCEENNTRLTIQYNPSVFNRLNGQRYQPFQMLTNIYNHIYNGGSLSSITQDILDLNNDQSPGAWIIEE
jgi:hypothetical protein